MKVSSREVKKDKKDMQTRAMIKDMQRIDKDFDFKGDFKELQEVYHSFVNQKPLIENKEDKIKKELLTLIDKNKINIF